MPNLHMDEDQYSLKLDLLSASFWWMVILITGGAGFIGSNLIYYWLAQNPSDTIVNFDALTYAGNFANLAGVESNPNYHFFQGDLRKQEQLDEVFEQFSIDSVIHLAAESHVDRSINDPSPFIDSNIKGTFQDFYARF